MNAGGARRIRATAVVDWSSLADASGNSAIFGVSWDGSIAACVRRSSECPTMNRGIGIFPKSRLDAPTDYHVVAWNDGRTREMVVRKESLALHHIQVLSDGVLLASARACWRPEGAERNAVIYDWNGQVRSRLCLGDGIQDIRTSPDGTIWVSYFDEGVFGNYGWGNPGPTPIGNPGLVGFDQEGRVRFQYDATSAGTDTMVDAYALNVGKDGVAWVYFYTEFPLVRIESGKYRVWSLGIGGCRALAVRGERALLFGDYKRPTLARRIRMSEDGKAGVDSESEIEDPDGRPLTQPFAIGVGDRLYLIQDGRVLVAGDW